MFFAFPEDARWNADRQVVEFGVEIGEYRGVVRVPRRVFQRLLPEGCWTFDARDRIPRSSRLSVHPFTAAAENAPTATRTSPAKAGSLCAGHAQ
jgi:hypothetical protein